MVEQVLEWSATWLLSVRLCVCASECWSSRSVLMRWWESSVNLKMVTFKRTWHFCRVTTSTSTETRPVSHSSQVLRAHTRRECPTVQAREGVGAALTRGRRLLIVIVLRASAGSSRPRSGADSARSCCKTKCAFEFRFALRMRTGPPEQSAARAHSPRGPCPRSPRSRARVFH